MPEPVKTTSFQFTMPVGVALTQFHTHAELRFLKSDCGRVLEWWKQQVQFFESMMPSISQDMVIEPCTDCKGSGQVTGQTTGRLQVCDQCHGSGRKGFIVPGMPAKPAPVEQKVASIPNAHQKSVVPSPSQQVVVRPTSTTPTTIITKERLDEALAKIFANGEGPVSAEQLLAALEPPTTKEVVP